jgi:hypothetical protein
MQEVGFFVLCMNETMGPHVKIKKFMEQVLVNFTRKCGRDFSVIILANSCLAFEGCCTGLVKIYHGSLLKTQMHNLMTNQHLMCSMKPTPCHTNFTVLKLYVHHVELSLRGQNLPSQNHLLTLCTFWRWSIQQKNQAQITYALTKPV